MYKIRHWQKTCRYLDSFLRIKGANIRPSYLMTKAGTRGEDHCHPHRFFARKDVKFHGEAPYEVSVTHVGCKYGEYDED